VVALAGYLKTDIEWSGDERQIYHSSPGIQRGFCGKCGTPLIWEGNVEELDGDRMIDPTPSRHASETAGEEP
jgi:hypothetical protein